MSSYAAWTRTETTSAATSSTSISKQPTATAENFSRSTQVTRSRSEQERHECADTATRHRSEVHDVPCTRARPACSQADRDDDQRRPALRARTQLVHGVRR